MSDYYVRRCLGGLGAGAVAGGDLTWAVMLSPRILLALDLVGLAPQARGGRGVPRRVGNDVSRNRRTASVELIARSGVLMREALVC